MKTRFNERRPIKRINARAVNMKVPSRLRGVRPPRPHYSDYSACGSPGTSRLQRTGGICRPISLGKTLAGLNAQSKGQRLGIFHPSPKELKKVHERRPSEEFRITLLGRALPAVNTKQEVRAVIKAKPIEPEGVEQYLESKFRDALPEVRKAMTELANALKPNELAQKGFGLYEQFRPAIPEGVQGWGAKGELDLGRITKLALQTH
jgi:hypothetical protein